MSNWMAGWKPTRYPGIFEGKGKYRVRVRAIDPRTGTQKEVNRIYENITLQEAVGKQVELRRAGRLPASKARRVRIGEFAQSWIKSKAGVVSKNTLEGYANSLDRHVLPTLGKYYYDATGPMEVQSWINASLAIEGEDGQRLYSRRSVEDWFRLFRNMTRDAIAQLGLSRDPTLRVKFPDEVLDHENEEDSILTLTEFHRFLDAMKCKRPASYALTLTLGLTGQRFCHVSALKWGDIDWENGLIRFRRKQVRGEVGPISRRKPTPREVPMLPELADALQDHRNRNQTLEWRGSGLGHATGPDDFLFLSNQGTLRQPSSLQNAFAAALREADIDKKVSPHGLRYLFNDVLRMAGVDPVSARSLTGHVTEEMREHYSTVRLEEKRLVMERVGERLRRARSGDSAEPSGDSGGDSTKKGNSGWRLITSGSA